MHVITFDLEMTGFGEGSLNGPEEGFLGFEILLSWIQNNQSFKTSLDE